MPVKTVNTADNYTADNAVSTGHPVESITLTVLNAAIDAQFSVIDQPGLGPGAFSFNRPEEPLIPGVWTYRSEDFGGFKLGGVQVKSQVPGASAKVTIRA